VNGCTKFYVSAWEELELKVTSTKRIIALFAITFPGRFDTIIFSSTFWAEKWDHFFKLGFHQHILVTLPVIKRKARFHPYRIIVVTNTKSYIADFIYNQCTNFPL